jgi:hypothetical protein
MIYAIGNTILQSVKDEKEQATRYKLTIRGKELEDTLSCKSLLELRDLIGMATMRGRE